MALEHHFTKDDHIFVGEDKFLDFVMYTDHTKTVVLDTSAMALEFALRKKDASPDPPLIFKSTAESPPGIIHVGTYNADPVVNTQKVRIILYDTDSYDDTVSPLVALKQRKYRHSIKRMDPGAETILSWGNFQFLRATLAH